MGIFVTVVGAGSSAALGAVAIYITGHAAVKSSLFLSSGTLLNRFGSVDEFTLQGKGKQLREGSFGERLLMLVFLLAALGLAGLPPFAAGLGKALAETAMSDDGLHWAPYVMIMVGGLTAGAVLRAWGRIFLGLGGRVEGVEAEGLSGDQEQLEVDVGPHVPVSMFIPQLALLVAGIGVGLLPGIAGAAATAAERYLDGAGYAAAVLDGHSGYPPVTGPEPPGWDAKAMITSVITVLVACTVAAIALYRGRIPGMLGRDALFARPAGVLHRLHSGRVGDYAVWLLLGVGAAAVILLVS
jgi:multicomponent Na+:H+ antiporter subunit D